MSWQDHAACKGKHGELFFAPEDERPKAKENRIARAKAICATCPVAEQCLAYAEKYEEQHGIWGGLTEKERGANRWGRRKRVVREIHGTTWGAHIHRKNGERPCDECRAAVNNKMREWKTRKVS